MKDCFEEAIKYDEDCMSVPGFTYYAKLFVADWNNLNYSKDLTIKKILEGKNFCTPFCSFSISDDLSIQKKTAITYSQDKLSKVHRGKKYSYNNNYNHIHIF